MRILIATPYLPWPLDSGGRVAQFSTLAALSSEHSFVIVCPANSSNTINNAEELEARLPHVRVRIANSDASLTPAPVTSISERPLRKTIDALRKIKRVSKAAAVALSSYTCQLRATRKPGSSQIVRENKNIIPFYPFEPLDPRLIDELNEALKENFDIFQVEFVEVLSALEGINKPIPSIFIHHQLHWIYAERFLLNCEESDYGNYIKNLIKVQEIALLQPFDAVVAFSDTDANLLKLEIPHKPIYVSPFPVPIDVAVAPAYISPFSNNFVFLGSSSHSPNQQALEWLLDEIWPIIHHKIPSASLKVIGDWPYLFNEHLLTPSISFEGFIEDLVTILRGSILLVPLKVGSGIRTKILAAMAQYVPVISTPVGCEGLAVTPGVNILVESDAIAFANSAIETALNPDLFTRIAISGRSFIDSNYSADQVCQTRTSIYNQLVAPRMN